MSRRSRMRLRRGDSAELQINLAAMLDMAFQLLAFFVLTFRPSAVEGHFQVHLPPPIPSTNVGSAKEVSADEKTAAAFEKLEKLDIFISADSVGLISEVRIGTRTVVSGGMTEEGMADVTNTIRTLTVTDDMPFTSVLCFTDSKLRYGELMRIVGACTSHALPNGEFLKVNLAEYRPKVE